MLSAYIVTLWEIEAVDQNQVYVMIQQDYYIQSDQKLSVLSSLSGGAFWDL